MVCLDRIVVLKTLAFVGVWLTAGGTVLLWRSSPIGYPLGVWASSSVIEDNNRNNRRMGRLQRTAVALIVMGAMLQMPLIILG